MKTGTEIVDDFMDYIIECVQTIEGFKGDVFSHKIPCSKKDGVLTIPTKFRSSKGNQINIECSIKLKGL